MWFRKLKLKLLAGAYLTVSHLNRPRGGTQDFK